MAIYDYSTARPDPSQLSPGVIRYLCPLPNPKALTSDELTTLWNASLFVGLVWEYDTSDYLGGYDQGVTYGTEARRQANTLTFPTTVPIYWAVDTRLTDSQLPLAVDYGRGFTSAAGIARPYGEAALIDAAVAAGLCDGGWAPETWGNSPNIILSQLVNTPSPVPGTDWSNVIHPELDWGGYHPAAGGNDMTPEEVQAACAQALISYFGDHGQFISDRTDQILSRLAEIEAKLNGMSSSSGPRSGTWTTT